MQVPDANRLELRRLRVVVVNVKQKGVVTEDEIVSARPRAIARVLLYQRDVQTRKSKRIGTKAAAGRQHV
jgi:hypothetical protein